MPTFTKPAFRDASELKVAFANLIEMLISITGLSLGSRGRGLILSLYWSLEVVPKSVLQPQRPTGRSEFETCNTSMSRTSIDAY